MEEINKVKEYAKAKYPRTFEKISYEVTGGARGNQRRRVITPVDPIVVDGGNFWMVSNHRDASPIILSKGIV